MKKFLVILLLLVTIFTLAACSQKDKIPYSVGLDENGYYIDLDKKNLQSPDFTGTTVSMDNVLDFALQTVQSNGYSVKTVNELIEAYVVSYLEYLNINTKDEVEETDIVTAFIAFYKDDLLMEDYINENTTLEAKKDGDIIVSSLIGHKKGDKYDIQYTFDKDDEYHPNETVTVKCEILEIQYADPLANGVVEAHIEEIQKEFPNATDVESLIEEMKPYVATYQLSAYVENLLLSVKIDIPEEFVNYEYQRFLARLSQLGYTYEGYLKESQQTDEQVKETCRSAAIENTVSMLVFKNSEYEITDEFMRQTYGTEQEDYDYYVMMQGEPYMKLRVIRATALDIIAAQVKLVDADGNPIVLDEHIEEELNGSDTSENTDELPTADPDASEDAELLTETTAD